MANECDRLHDALNDASWVRVEPFYDSCRVFVWKGGAYVDVLNTNFEAETTLCIDEECPTVEQAIQGYFGLEETLLSFLDSLPTQVTEEMEEHLRGLSYHKQRRAIDLLNRHYLGECRCVTADEEEPCNYCVVHYWFSGYMDTKTFVEFL